MEAKLLVYKRFIPQPDLQYVLKNVITKTCLRQAEDGSLVSKENICTGNWKLLNDKSAETYNVIIQNLIYSADKPSSLP